MSAGVPRTVTSADGTSIGYRSTGEGQPVIVIGGALRTAEDYMPLATALARRFEVHVIDRRGRGGSGSQGAGYSVERECDDVEAVMSATGATRLFGHSYGGLVALQVAKRNPAVEGVVAYEPGVSIRGSIPTDWLADYAPRLARGDTRGAFAVFVRGSGHAPPIVRWLPLGYLKLVLRLAIKPAQWRRMEPLLQANLAEHEEVRRLDGDPGGYAQVAAEVLLLAGAKSPKATRIALEALGREMPHATCRVVEGLAHNAPDEAAPARVAELVEQFFAAPSRQ